ncbi:MAG: hypothetical protein QMC98_03305 [Candidatus Thermoplasmatota archaeon]|nr:hypothetical protein [Candidatus Thermoplasmatota archaeon]
MKPFFLLEKERNSSGKERKGEEAFLSFRKRKKLFRERKKRGRSLSFF